MRMAGLLARGELHNLFTPGTKDLAEIQNWPSLRPLKTKQTTNDNQEDTFTNILTKRTTLDRDRFSKMIDIIFAVLFTTR